MIEIIANRKQVAEQIKAAAEMYLSKHPKEEKIAMFKMHTNQNAARWVLHSVNSFLSSDTMPSIFMKVIYDEHIHERKGELADALALAIRICLDQTLFNDAETRVAEAAITSSSLVDRNSITRKVIDRIFDTEVKENNSCGIQ